MQRQSGKVQKVAQTMFPMEPALMEDFSEIKNMVRISSWENVPLQRPGRTASIGVLFGADPSFLHIFNFELLQGNRKAALTTPGTIVLTRKLARQLFGNDDPVGQTVQHQGRDTINFPACRAALYELST